jgi:hypothetical protein
LRVIFRIHAFYKRLYIFSRIPWVSELVTFSPTNGETLSWSVSVYIFIYQHFKTLHMHICTCVYFFTHTVYICICFVLFCFLYIYINFCTCQKVTSLTKMFLNC